MDLPGYVERVVQQVVVTGGVVPNSRSPNASGLLSDAEDDVVRLESRMKKARW